MKLVSLLILLQQTCSLAAQTSSNGPVDIQSIADSVKRLENTVATLQSNARSDAQMYATQIAVLRTELTRAENDLRTSQTEAAKLRQDLQTALFELSVVKSQVVSSGMSQNATEKDLKVIQDELGRLKANVTAIVPDVMSNQALLSSMSSHINSTIQDIKGLKSDADAEKQNMSSMWNDLRSMEAKSDSTIKEITKISSDVQSLSHDVSASNQALQGVESKQQIDDAKVSALTADMDVLKSNVTDLFHQHTVDAYNLAELNAHLELLEKDVAFEATIAYGSGTTTVPRGAALRFSTVAYNAGNGYDPSTGVFTAPVSGIYLLWANVVYDNTNIPLELSIKSSRALLGVGYGNTADGGGYGTVSTITVADLRKGETVWFTPNRGMKPREWYSSIGGGLLRVH